MPETKRYVFHGIGVIVAILFAQWLSGLGYFLIGWFGAGLIMALSTQYTLVAPEKRQVGRMVLVTGATGIVTAGVALLVNIYV